MNVVKLIDITKKPVVDMGYMQFKIIPREGDWVELLIDDEINIFAVLTVCHTINDNLELYVMYYGTKDEAIDSHCSEPIDLFPMP